ncbi:MAG TPA: choice-of-anchor tandem repeat GloVer-containing protein [Rhizomicrobium sp.]|nr:choice-of-anchor tandem repeat GloVer-containing protein [Rhizomicrobium sp.]
MRCLQALKTVLYSFTGGNDGSSPNSGLLMKKGNLYGMTFGGGTSGDGTVFELTSDGTETVLHSFAGGSGGETPSA